MSEIEGAVRALTGSATARVVSWQLSAVAWRVVSEVTGGLHRLSGTLEDGGRLSPWSLVVKVNRPPPGCSEADEAEWRREEFAYTSGVLRPGNGFAMARCLAVTRPSAEETWLWLEDVRDEGGALWEVDRHAAASRHLSVFNGSHRVVSRSEAPPWLLGGWLEQLQPLADDEVAEWLHHADVWYHPSVKLAFPEPVLEPLVRLSDAAPSPRTLRHALLALPPRPRAVQPVFPDGSRRCWEDGLSRLANPLAGAARYRPGDDERARLYVRPGQAKRYHEVTFTAYLEGVREGGFDDVESVYRTYTALAALRAGVIARTLVYTLVADGDKQTWAEA